MTSRTRYRYIGLGIVLVVLVGMQFRTADRSNPVTSREQDISSQSTIPHTVRDVLVRGCMDCHSNKTDWPWFSYVAPFSWIVSDGVHEGRSHLNFSEWTNRTPQEQRDLLQRITDVVRYDKMPPTPYQWTHAGARLSTSDRFTLYFWARNELSRLSH